MRIKKTKFKGLVVLNGIKHNDKRGYLIELVLEKLIKKKFKFQITSVSKKNVLRGLHFQNPPFAQGKLVRVIKGSVLDVAVDIRRDSPTYGRHFKQVLSEQNKTMMYIPEGFAHGLLTLENDTIFSYKCTNYYNKESEKCMLWIDKILDINWEIEKPILSEKDKRLPNIENFKHMEKIKSA